MRALLRGIVLVGIILGAEVEAASLQDVGPRAADAAAVSASAGDLSIE